MKNHVFIPDVHGQADHLERAVNFFDTCDPETNYVLTGDVIDKGPEVKAALEIIRDLGPRAVLLLGNHEYVLRAALDAMKPEDRSHWQAKWWGLNGRPPYQDGFTLRSYGIEPSDKTCIADTAEMLKQAMEAAGHWDLLCEARLYARMDGIIAVHAGLNTTESLDEQCRQLDNVAQELSRHHYPAMPEQIASQRLGNLALTAGYLGITLVTGHMHEGGVKAEDRIRLRHHGAHIALASEVTDGDPLFVWSREDNQVFAF